MNETEASQLKRTVENMHGGQGLARPIGARPRVLRRQAGMGRRVHVFDLAGHPTATRAYAWSSPIEGRTKRRFLAVLHTARINSPLEAVRAAIVQDIAK